MILTLYPINHCGWFGGWSGIILDSWTTGGWILGDLEQSRDIQIRPDTQQNIPESWSPSPLPSTVNTPEHSNFRGNARILMKHFAYFMLLPTSQNLKLIIRILHQQFQMDFLFWHTIVFSLHGEVAKLKRCDSVIYFVAIHSTFFLFVSETVTFLRPKLMGDQP